MIDLDPDDTLHMVLGIFLKGCKLIDLFQELITENIYKRWDNEEIS